MTLAVLQVGAAAAGCVLPVVPLPNKPPNHERPTGTAGCTIPGCGAASAGSGTAAACRRGETASAIPPRVAAASAPAAFAAASFAAFLLSRRFFAAAACSRSKFGLSLRCSSLQSAAFCALALFAGASATSPGGMTARLLTTVVPIDQPLVRRASSWYDAWYDGTTLQR